MRLQAAVIGGSDGSVSPIIQNGILTDLRDGSPAQIMVDSD